MAWPGRVVTALTSEHLPSSPKRQMTADRPPACLTLSYPCYPTAQGGPCCIPASQMRRLRLVRPNPKASILAPHNVQGHQHTAQRMQRSKGPWQSSQDTGTL